MFGATVADTIRDVASLVGAIMVIVTVIWGVVKFARRIDATLDEVRTHVIPHFRPATVDEIRVGRRRPGDTIPERMYVVERDVAKQTKDLADHLSEEATTNQQIAERLAHLEQKAQSNSA